MGHEIAIEIKRAKDEGKQIVFILPVGPMGMYRWAVYFLSQWNIDCKHVHGYNMDEWSDAEGNTLPKSNPGAFQYAMEQALYGPLGRLTIPERQRHFATKKSLPSYKEEIFELQDKGARLVVVYGIGRVFHIAFWEPHFAGEFATDEEWKSQDHRVAAKLHPLTIEQNAITSFKSRTTLVSTRANTIGPGLFLIFCSNFFHDCEIAERGDFSEVYKFFLFVHQLVSPINISYHLILYKSIFRNPYILF